MGVSTTYKLDKTFHEIKNAFLSGKSVIVTDPFIPTKGTVAFIIESDSENPNVVGVNTMDGNYKGAIRMYATENENDYPIHNTTIAG